MSFQLIDILKRPHGVFQARLSGATPGYEIVYGESRFSHRPQHPLNRWAYLDALFSLPCFCSFFYIFESTSFFGVGHNLVIEVQLLFFYCVSSIIDLDTNQTIPTRISEIIGFTLYFRCSQQHDLRFSLSLCEEEKTFLRERRQRVLKKMQVLLGQKAPKNKDEVSLDLSQTLV